jgi:hypothetical protein
MKSSLVPAVLLLAACGSSHPAAVVAPVTTSSAASLSLQAKQAQGGCVALDEAMAKPTVLDQLGGIIGAQDYITKAADDPAFSTLARDFGQLRSDADQSIRDGKPLATAGFLDSLATVHGDCASLPR